MKENIDIEPDLYSVGDLKKILNDLDDDMRIVIGKGEDDYSSYSVICSGVIGKIVKKEGDLEVRDWGVSPESLCPHVLDRFEPKERVLLITSRGYYRVKQTEEIENDR